MYKMPTRFPSLNSRQDSLSAFNIKHAVGGKTTKTGCAGSRAALFKLQIIVLYNKHDDV